MKHNVVKNSNWQEASHYFTGRGSELGTTENKFSQRSERDLSSAPPNCKSRVLTTRTRFLLLLFFTVKKNNNNNNNKNDKHDVLINKVNVHIKASTWTGAILLPVFTVLRIIRLINYRLITRTLKRASCFFWVQAFENTCTNRNLTNELRRWLDRNRMLLEMVFQAFLGASCIRKRTFNQITTFTWLSWLS